MARIRKVGFLCPEFTAPLISGRPDFVIFTKKYLLIIELKTGKVATRSAGVKQLKDYSRALWGKLKIARELVTIPILVKENGKVISNKFELPTEINSHPEVFSDLNPKGLISLLKKIESVENGDLVEFSYIKRKDNLFTTA